MTQPVRRAPRKTAAALGRCEANGRLPVPSKSAGDNLYSPLCFQTLSADNRFGAVIDSQETSALLA